MTLKTTITNHIKSQCGSHFGTTFEGKNGWNCYLKNAHDNIQMSTSINCQVTNSGKSTNPLVAMRHCSSEITGMGTLTPVNNDQNQNQWTYTKKCYGTEFLNKQVCTTQIVTV